MNDDFMATWHQQMVDAGMATADHRVYILVDLANAVLKGRDLTDEERGKLGQFPYALEVLDLMARRRGTLQRISVSPGPEATLDTFAKAWLAVDWEVLHRHTSPVRVIDPLWGWATDVRTMRRRFYIRWRRAPAWLLDRLQRAITKLRIVCDRLRGVSNPYQDANP